MDKGVWRNVSLASLWRHQGISHGNGNDNTKHKITNQQTNQVEHTRYLISTYWLKYILNYSSFIYISLFQLLSVYFT